MQAGFVHLPYSHWENVFEVIGMTYMGVCFAQLTNVALSIAHLELHGCLIAET